MKKESDGRRVARVEREVQQTIAQFLISGFRSPLPGLVTVARVQMPADLRMAKVYISVLGEASSLDETVDLLQERAFEIQNYIGKELKMRYCPKLQFFADSNTEQILKVERILADLETERKGRGASDASDDSNEEE
ncbi:30S ribosome-binding factor RbfA [Bdellovibrio sp. HCB337]|uniref:30S ribosome-binding factor RbfA n=1 Tax=Bdellovibrio sp. HCB337 TaxID=3394358 RepID=UPI0039A40DF8